MLVTEHIAQLVAYAPGVSDDLIDIAVRVAIYPVFNRAVCNETAKLHGKCPIERTALDSGAISSNDGT